MKLPKHLFRYVVAAGCLYELAALWTRLPTISRIVNTLNEFSWTTRVIAWAWSGGWAWHFLSHTGTVPDEK